MIFKYILDYTYSKFNQLLSSWNQGILQPNKPAKLLWVCWWNSFTDFLSKEKSKHCFIMVTSEHTASSFKVWVYLINSLLTLVAPISVNGMIVLCHTSLGCSRIYRDQYWHKNQPLCIYGDPAYPSSFHLQVPCSRQNLTPNPVNYNKAMSQIRVSVEWLFNEIETYLKFVSYTNICLFSNSP